MTDAQLPTAIEAEAHVIGAVLKDPNAMYAVSEYITGPEEFWDDRYRVIYTACHELFTSGKTTDLVTVANRLRADGQLTGDVSMTYLTELAEHAIVTPSVGSHARLVNETFRKRNLVGVCKSIIVNVNRSPEYSELIRQLQESVGSLSLSDRNHVLRPVKDVVIEAYNAVMSLFSGKKRAEITTGFADLDRLVELMKGRLIVLAARPGLGKTSMALNIAENVAIGQGKPVDYFSLEMGDTELASRVLMGRARVPIRKAKDRVLTDGDVSVLNGAVEEIGLSPLYIHDISSAKVYQLRDRIWQAKNERGCALAIVDYLGLVAPNRDTGSQTNNISAVARGLKSIAKELSIPIIALSQLNRVVEYRNNKRPCLSDLRDSGEIEQAADYVLFLYRDSYYWNEDDKRDPKKRENAAVAECIIAKSRDGEVGTVNLHWEPSLARYSNYVVEEFAL